MWVCLSLLTALCLLPGGGAESQGGRAICQQPPDWKIGEVTPMKDAEGRVTVVALLQASWLFCLVQASKMDSLRQKVEGQGLINVNYMVVNHKDAQSQRLHSLLDNRLSSSITLYKQENQDADVWQALNGEKDDFLIYDRCGRLTSHIALPYSIIGQGHIENAIRESYCKPICGNCSHNSVDVPEVCTRPVVEARPEEEEEVAAAAVGAVPAAREEDAVHGDGQGRGHHGHGHHHGDQQGVAHGHQHHGHGRGGLNRGRHGGGQQVMVQGQHQQGSGSQAVVRQVEGFEQLAVDDIILLRVLGQAQAQVPQEAQGAPVMQRPWPASSAKWKSKHSWQLRTASGSEAARRSSWCWHWRRLLANAGQEPLVGTWHCDEALPASWQWRGLTGIDATNHITETWQWRVHPADWQQPQPAQWAWPPGVASWGWEQM